MPEDRGLVAAGTQGMTAEERDLTEEMDQIAREGWGVRAVQVPAKGDDPSVSA